MHFHHKTPRHNIAFLLTVSLGWLACSTAQADLCLVDKDANGANNGSSWEDAYTDLLFALARNHCDEFWVAAGTYKPTDDMDRQPRFIIRPGSEVYGGFAGIETEREQRNPRANPTILSGDLGGGVHTIALVFIEGFDKDIVIRPRPSVLDGFTVTGGSTGPANDYGGGIYVDAGAFNPGFGKEASPILRNLIIKENTAQSGGGGLYINASLEGISRPVLENVTFIDNTAESGAAMYVDGHDAEACPTLNNVTFFDNHAEYYAAGLLSIHDVGQACLTLNNVTLSGNTSGLSGSAITVSAGANIGGTPTFNNVIVWDNPVSDNQPVADLHSVTEINGSVIEGGCPSGSTCTNVISTDPLLGALGDHGGNTPTIPIAKTGSAFDAGDDVTCLPTDQRGVPRPQGEHCDIGAYERTVGFFSDGFESPPSP